MRLALLVLVACGQRESVTKAPHEASPDEALARRCPDAPRGDAAAHIAAVERARVDPAAAKALDNEHWRELWAVAARTSVLPPRADWPTACLRQGDLYNCFQLRWAGEPVELGGVTEVSCTGCRVGDLAPLAALERLSLSDTYLERPDSLGALGNLTKLYLDNTNVGDASGLVSLSRLTELTLAGPFVHEVRDVAGLRQLTALTVSSNCVTDASAIGALTQLRQLFIWGPRIERLPDFAAFTALERLHVTASKVTASPSFRALGELRDLVWEGPAPLDVEQLAALTNLRSVALMRHCIPDAAIEALRRAKPGLDLHTGERHPTCPR